MIRKIKKYILPNLITVLLGLLVLAPSAQAVASFNNDPADFPTLRVSNYTLNPSPNSPANWYTSINASAGDIVSFSIYYHNTSSNETANSTRVSLSVPSGAGTNINANGQLWASNAATVSGSASVQISSAQTLTYIPGSVRWYPNQSQTSQALPFGQNGSEILTSTGLNIGNIAPGWSTQGSVAVRFQVSGTATPPPGNNLPSVTTNGATSIVSDSATLNGYVNPNSTLDTYRWFEWGRTTSVRFSTNRIAQGSGAGNFSEALDGLFSNTTYYFRAVAQNSAGTVYGSILSFNTGTTGGGSQLPTVITNSATNISQSYAQLNGYVDPNGTTDTQRWFDWGTNTSVNNFTSRLSQGSSASNFSITISGLNSNTTYYFRAVAQNSNGTVYGSILSFNTGTSFPGQTPDITTNSATSIAQNSAYLNGYVNPNGTSDTYRWFEWGRTSSVRDSTGRIYQGNNSSNFSEYLTGLNSNTTYYFRAVAQNSNGTVYGSILSFNTGTTGGGSQAPLVITNSASNITQNSAVMNGFINPYNTSDTLRWFEWSPNLSLGNSTSKIFQGNFSSNFSESIPGLNPNTSYYFRAVAQNSNGTTYGTILNFTTTGTVVTLNPVALTNSATAITTSSAQLNGVALPGNNVFTYGWFEWGTLFSLGNQTSSRGLGSNSVMNFSDTLGSLSASTVYYFRAVTQNQNGTARGNILSFRTTSVFVPPPAPVTLSLPAPQRAPVGTTRVTLSKEVANLSFPNGTKTSVAALTGNTLQFTIEVKNTGTIVANNLTLKDNLSPFLEFAGASNGGQYSSAGNDVSWNINGLEPGQSIRLSLNVTAQKLADNVVAENTAIAVNGSGSTVARSNSVIAIINTSPVILTVSSDKENIGAGETVAYTIRYKNEGKSEVKNVVLKIVLPTGLKYQESDTPGLAQKENVLTLNISNLASEAEGAVSYKVKVDKDVEDKKVLTTTAVISYTDTFSSIQGDVSAYVSNIVEGQGKAAGGFLGAGIIGLGGLFPETLGGWLLLIINVLILATLVKAILNYRTKTGSMKFMA